MISIDWASVWRKKKGGRGGGGQVVEGGDFLVPKQDGGAVPTWVKIFV